LIIDETNRVNESEGKDFDVSSSVISQIPFFACNNMFLEQSVQRDVERYIYCEKFGLPPYSGDYGQQPYTWVKRAFAIRSALAKREKREIDARSNK
tara:strand:- start:884 stop:1171 length:288 start_codon:yes stop_codon:yes gene_type:complete